MANRSVMVSSISRCKTFKQSWERIATLFRMWIAKNETLVDRRVNDIGIEVFVLVVILSLAAYFRFYHLSDRPGWYSDEGTILEIVKHLSHGSIQYMAINQSTLLAARLPLFPLVLKWIMSIFGFGIETLRMTTASLGVLDVLILSLVLRRIMGFDGRWFAYVAGFGLAIFPKAIFYNRLGFSYNLLTPLILLAWFGGWRYLTDDNKYWLGISALAIGIGGVSDLMMFSMVLPFFLIVLSRNWRDLRWSLPILLIPLGIYAGIMLLTVPSAFIFDLKFILLRMGSIPAHLQLPLITLNLGALFTWDAWILAGMVGLFLLWPNRLRRLTILFFFAPVILLGRTTGLVGFGFYYLSPLLPFIALGVSTLIWRGTPYVLSFFTDALHAFLSDMGIDPSLWVSRRLSVILVSLSSFFIAFSPLIVSLVLTNNDISTGYETFLSDVLIDAKNAREALTMINKLIEPEDLVIASPALIWGINGRTSDFQITLAFEGKRTEHFPDDIPRDRFAYDPSLESARYVIVDPIWRNWAAKAMPEVEKMMRSVEEWPLVYQAGEISIYRNPDIQ